MKILMITPKYFPTISGNTFTVSRIADSLKRKGHKVRVITPDLFGNIKFKPNIIHVFHASKGFVPEILETRLPFIVTLTGTDINHDINIPSRIPNLKLCISNAAHITAFKPEPFSAFLSKLGIKTKNYSIITPSVDLPKSSFRFRKNLGISQKALLFLLVASIRDVKDPLYAVKEIAILRQSFPQTRLVILGESSDKQLADKLNKLGKSFLTISKISHKYMQSAYNESDFILNTSISEGLSNALLEAISLDRPILASDIPGNLILPRTCRFRKEQGALAKLAIKKMNTLKKLQKSTSQKACKYHINIPTRKHEALAYSSLYHRYQTANSRII